MKEFLNRCPLKSHTGPLWFFSIFRLQRKTVLSFYIDCYRLSVGCRKLKMFFFSQLIVISRMLHAGKYVVIKVEGTFWSRHEENSALKGSKI